MASIRQGKILATPQRGITLHSISSHLTQNPAVHFEIPGFPHYEITEISKESYLLRGAHFRYEPYKDRAKLWLPLRKETIPGTPFKRYDSVSLTIFDPTTNTHLEVTPHSICQSRHPWRGYIRLDWTATTYLKQTHTIHTTRLVNNPKIEVVLSPGNHPEPIGPPNQWKPEFFNQIYKLGLLEETAHTLHYDTVIKADIRFQGGGNESRPDIFATMSRTTKGITTESLVIVEGKACHDRKATYYLLEGTIQALHKKIQHYAYRLTADAVVAVTGEVNKLTWNELVTTLKRAKELPYNKTTRRNAQEIWRNIRKKEEYWKRWYEEHLHVHGISDLLYITNNRRENEREEILKRLKLIRWR